MLRRASHVWQYLIDFYLYIIDWIHSISTWIALDKIDWNTNHHDFEIDKKNNASRILLCEAVRVCAENRKFHLFHLETIFELHALCIDELVKNLKSILTVLPSTQTHIFGKSVWIIFCLTMNYLWWWFITEKEKTSTNNIVSYSNRPKLFRNNLFIIIYTKVKWTVFSHFAFDGK